MRGEFHVDCERHGIAESCGVEDSVVLVVRQLTGAGYTVLELCLHRVSGKTRLPQELFSRERGVFVCVVLEGRGVYNSKQLVEVPRRHILK